ncbi:NADH-quinone oxidoreductase subunit 5 family protein [Sphingobacterium hotanense]|uniref:NADH-quinone oxidoreductase subunit 5 family protein n=1 Tax=Sphingobacterium hotanense TaxID=649196 RepID=UPI0021A3E168|nr:NADH-quinone oxidoreductase subunit L [Sphingobacterium hotanense]MCT1525433.1 NADH-quinone oxidoreductase subunit L [Sphingobacterium hotanense]
MVAVELISPVFAATAVVALPFIAFLIQAILGKRSTSGNISLIAICLSTVISLLFVFAEVWQSIPRSATQPWFTIGINTFTVGVLLNNLTVLMQLLVCVIALPVHIYSRAYMKGDPGIHRYWMYLSLFCFAMLGLCISKNLFMMYIFWELVGFASYLLIGFWFTKESAVQANKKAFIVNRIGDLGFLIGIATVFSVYGTLDLVELFGKEGRFYSIASDNSGLLTLAGIGFFIGAMAKSAQFPLHVWLPDAMEGPTAVSSLIHAATMVAAGVFLLSSVFPLFNDTVLLIIAIIGVTTAASAAYFALAQTDIKKILAFSTISQLGFMMVAIGVGAWDAAMFHLVTHAFFKCLLFLGAGAVIHEMAHLKHEHHLDFDPQNINNMGGLRKQMPKTFMLMAIASLALAGFPLTSGFLSKDAILISSYEWAISKGGASILIPILLTIVSVLTAFYIGRLIFKVFFEEFKLSVSPSNIHDANNTMLLPMAFLGVCSLFFVFSFNPISYQDANVFQGFYVDYNFEEVHSLHLLIPIGLTLASCFMWIIAWRWYVKGSYPLNAASKGIAFSLNQAYLNQFYTRTFVAGTVNLSKGLYWFDRNIIDGIVNQLGALAKEISRVAAWIDKYIVDGFINTLGGTTYYFGHLLRWVQNGRLQNYLGFAFTVLLIGIIYLILT